MSEVKQEKTIKNFFKLLGVKTDVRVLEDEESVSIVLDSDESGIIIGYHGETLEALQTILSLVLAKESGDFKRVSIEVGDYRKNREQWLEKLALEAKDKALLEKKEVMLTDLKPWERRVVHVLLQEDKDIITESTGEGKERVLVVKPK